MTTCLEERCPFGLLCVSFINVYQIFVCVILSRWVLRVQCRSVIILISDYFLSIYLANAISLEYQTRQSLLLVRHYKYL